MSQAITEEKRQHKRFLCDTYFTDCQLQGNAVQLDMTAIDFCKEGMGFFTSEFIPDSPSLTLSFRYSSPKFSYDFEKIESVLVHSNVTEVGSHCGVVFILAKLSDAQKQAIETIQNLLSQQDDPEDRYHLFEE